MVFVTDEPTTTARLPPLVRVMIGAEARRTDGRTVKAAQHAAASDALHQRSAFCPARHGTADAASLLPPPGRIARRSPRTRPRNPRIAANSHAPPRRLTGSRATC